MKIIARSVVLATVFLVPAMAQQKADDHSAHHPSSAASPTELVDGEVRKVDKGAAKLTIKHGEIKSIDMPPMTMVFQVKEPSLLDKVKAGDKVRFTVEKTDTGYVVTAIEAAQ
jgi:Cu(I)/Ag(I) efflux system periplasmic protein CusF